MYYIKKIIFFKKIIIFNYFYRSRSRYSQIIEYRDQYPKFGYPETTNPDSDIKSTDLDTVNFQDIQIRPMPNGVPLFITGLVLMFLFIRGKTRKNIWFIVLNPIQLQTYFFWVK